MSRPPGDRGFALLIVLWLLVPVSTLLILMAGAARSDTQLAGNLRTAAALQAAADGGIESALFELARTDTRREDGLGTLRLRLGGALVTVRATSLSGLVNPNVATPELLRAILVRLGAAPPQAESLASAIVDWHLPGQQRRADGAKAPQYQAAGLDYGPPGAPFESVGELREVLGMTPALFAALRPYLTLYTDAPPDAAVAPPLVLAALRDLGAVRPIPGQGTVFEIVAEAGSPAGLVVRRATVKIGPSPNGRPWRVLAWD